MKFKRSLICLSLACPTIALAAYDCNVSGPSFGVLYVNAATAVDQASTVTITCTRASGDPNTLTYRIKATTGNNSTGGLNRRVRLGATANVITYSLRRGATCNNASNWADPLTTGNIMTGTLNFGTALVMSATQSFCARMPAVAMPLAGVYTDTFQVRAQYPAVNGSPHSPYSSINYTIGVTNQCVFNTFPTGMSFNYTSFSATAQVQTRNFDLRCSNGLSWTLAVSPASNVLLGLTYNIAVTPAASLGTGNDQVITLTGTIPANQAGTCSGSSCTATQGHTVTITY